MGSKKSTGGAAFPAPERKPSAQALAFGGVQTERPATSDGMTLRDYFAAKVMASLVPLETATQMDEIARDAYMQADYMLAERAK